MNRNFTYYTGSLDRNTTSTLPAGIRYVKGDLFYAPKYMSLAHCVAKDFGMGAGIAVKFKQIFGQVDLLKAQKVKVGGVAVLSRNSGFSVLKKNIYYLVTKEHSFEKPTYPNFIKSIITLSEYCADEQTLDIAMPQIGCGLDKLDWNIVHKILKENMVKSGIRIWVFIL